MLQNYRLLSLSTNNTLQSPTPPPPLSNNLEVIVLIGDLSPWHLHILIVSYCIIERKKLFFIHRGLNSETSFLVHKTLTN